MLRGGAGRRALFTARLFTRLPSTSIDARRCDAAVRARGGPRP
jgi:hypothetical protein